MNRRGFFKAITGYIAAVVASPYLPAPAKKLLHIILPTRIWDRTLTKSEWMELDASVLRAAKLKLRKLQDHRP